MFTRNQPESTEANMVGHGQARGTYGSSTCVKLT